MWRQRVRQTVIFGGLGFANRNTGTVFIVTNNPRVTKLRVTISYGGTHRIGTMRSRTAYSLGAYPAPSANSTFSLAIETMTS